MELPVPCARNLVGHATSNANVTRIADCFDQRVPIGCSSLLSMNRVCVDSQEIESAAACSDCFGDSTLEVGPSISSTTQNTCSRNNLCRACASLPDTIFCRVPSGLGYCTKVQYRHPWKRTNLQKCENTFKRQRGVRSHEHSWRREPVARNRGAQQCASVATPADHRH